MATGNAKRFIELGIPADVATSLANQITSGAPSVRRLQEMGWTFPSCSLMAAAITATTVDRNKLAASGVPAPIVREFAAQIAS